MEPVRARVCTKQQGMPEQDPVSSCRRKLPTCCVHALQVDGGCCKDDAEAQAACKVLAQKLSGEPPSSSPEAAHSGVLGTPMWQRTV